MGKANQGIAKMGCNIVLLAFTLTLGFPDTELKISKVLKYLTCVVFLFSLLLWESAIIQSLKGRYNGPKLKSSFLSEVFDTKIADLQADTM